MNRMISIAIGLLLLGTQCVHAEEKVHAAYVVSDEQEQDIQIFLDSKHFRDCKTKQVRLGLQYGFGEISLVSALKTDGQTCIVVLEKLVEMGVIQKEECSVADVEAMNWMRNQQDEIKLLPPSCVKPRVTTNFVVDQNADPYAITNFLKAVDASQCNLNDVVVKYVNATVTLAFKKKDQNCNAEIKQANKATQSCAVDNLRKVAWFYDAQSYMRKQAPDFSECAVKNLMVSGTAEEKRQAVRDFFSYVFATFFSMLFGVR